MGDVVYGAGSSGASGSMCLYLYREMEEVL